MFFSKVSIDAFYLLDREMVGAVLYGNMKGKPNFQMALDVINDHKESTRSLVTHRYKLNDVQTAFNSAMDACEKGRKNMNKKMLCPEGLGRTFFDHVPLFFAFWRNYLNTNWQQMP